NDGVQGRLARGAMVGVVDVALPGPAAGWVRRDDHVRLGPADPTRDLPPEIQRRLQRTVIVAEEEDILDAQVHGRGALLCVSDLGQSLRRQRRVTAATIA